MFYFILFVDYLQLLLQFNYFAQLYHSMHFHHIFNHFEYIYFQIEYCSKILFFPYFFFPKILYFITNSELINES